MKSLSLFFFCSALLLPVRLISQEFPGAIIQNNDTVQGYIKEAPRYLMSLHVSFKKEGTSSYQVYKPNELEGFFYDEISYSSFKVVNIDMYNKTDTVDYFLRSLVRGTISLYELSLENKSDRLFAHKNNTLEELKNTNYYFYGDNGQQYKAYKKEYITTLSKQMFEIPGFNKRIINLTFSKKPIAKLIHEFNNEYSGSSEYMIQKNEIKVDVSANAFGEYHSQNSKTYDKPAYTAGAGMLFRFYSPRISKKFFFLTGLSYSHTTSYDKIISLQWYHDPYFSMETNRFSIPLIMRYHVLDKRISPYIDAGYNLDFEYTNYITDAPEPLPLYRSDPAYYAYKPLIFGLGLKMEIIDNFLLLAKYNIVNAAPSVSLQYVFKKNR